MIESLIAFFGPFGKVVEFGILVLASKEIYDQAKKWFKSKKE